MNPGAAEVCINMVDDDCNDLVDDTCCTDADGDGFSPDGGACGDVDCDDGNAAVNPGATEDCDNGIDDDCDGDIDEGDDDCALRREPAPQRELRLRHR